MQAHLQFLRPMIADKTIIMCGRQKPRVGGIIIANIESREKAASIFSNDPFTTAGVAEYEFIEFVASGVVDEIKDLVG
jgi:uncharacterized protein YciI